MANKCPDRNVIQTTNPVLVLGIALALVGVLMTAWQMEWSTAFLTDNPIWLVLLFFLSLLGVVAFTVWLIMGNACKESSAP